MFLFGQINPHLHIESPGCWTLVILLTFQTRLHALPIYSVGWNMCVSRDTTWRRRTRDRRDAPKGSNESAKPRSHENHALTVLTTVLPKTRTQLKTAVQSYKEFAAEGRPQYENSVFGIVLKAYWGLYKLVICGLRGILSEWCSFSCCAVVGLLSKEALCVSISPLPWPGWSKIEPLRLFGALVGKSCSQCHDTKSQLLIEFLI